MRDHVIGNYRILDKIGEGGMGEVFRGVDLMLEREVAIKSLRPEFVRRQDLIERFRTEARALARLNHPNIATLYSFFCQGGRCFMVMEFVQGRALDKVLVQAAPLSWPQAVPLFCQALQGIAHAHHLGVIHRDIKPANLMVTETGALKVLDFGIARLLGTTSMTKGRCFGTLAYMAPEQIRGQDTDTRTDVYALGVVLYEMLTGRTPFTACSEYELIKLQVEAMPTPPHRLVSQLPVPIEDAVMRALAKAPSARFQSVDEFLAALEMGTGITSSALSRVTARQRAPITRSNESCFDILSHTSRAQNRRNSRWPLSFLRAALSSLPDWTQYPGVIAMLVLIGIALGLIGVAAPTRGVVLGPTPTGRRSSPPVTSTNTQSTSVSAALVEEERKLAPRLSPEPGSYVADPPVIPLPHFPESETVSREKPADEQKLSPQESWQENEPTSKRKSRTAKSSVSSGKGKWIMIK